MPSASTDRLTRLLRQALQLALLRRPAGVAAPLRPGLFAAAALIAVLVGFGLDLIQVDAPRMFNRWAIAGRSFPLLFALAAGLVGGTLIGRPAIALRLAALLLLATLPLQLLLMHWPARWPRPIEPVVLLAIAGYVLALASRLFGWVASRRLHWRPLTASLLIASALLGSILFVPGPPWWWQAAPFDPGDEEAGARGYSAEALLYAQPALLQRALEQLQPQRPGTIDLYAIGFAGDGMESVFRNEVEHFERLVAERFDNPGRTLTLVNHPDTLEQQPLATLGNLRIALDALGRRMDVDEDILLLFLTSHGSSEHELHVALDDLPLDPVSPEQLADALDHAGIRWRVLIVSACYSGGFIEPLADEHTLIMTAARADRPSFGCGVTSEITWFGQALLAEAFNQTTDFAAAFEQARRAVRAREREQDERPSHPQLHMGEAIAARLRIWQASFTPGPEVAFVPAANSLQAAVTPGDGSEPDAASLDGDAEQVRGQGAAERPDTGGAKAD